MAYPVTGLPLIPLGCRLRKVKCDEGYPVCHRCESAGRFCHGYGIWGGGGQSYCLRQDDVNGRTLRPQSPSTGDLQARMLVHVQMMPLARTEQACFEWYTQRSAKKLPGAFRSDYWQTMLLRASVTEPAIRHAVLALGSSHRADVQGAGSLISDLNDERALCTVRQYSKAINHLQPYLSDKVTTSVRITLVACVLFVSMEFLRGHYSQGIIHLKHGLCLLQESAIIVQDHASTSASAQVDVWLVTIFTRLLVQAKLLGQIPTVSYQGLLDFLPQQDPETFSSVLEARRSLDHLLLRTFGLEARFNRTTGTPTTELGTELHTCQSGILMQLFSWSKNHEPTMSNSLSPPSAMERAAWCLLRLHHRLAIIIASTCLETCESRFDRHEVDFLMIISRAIELYSLRYTNVGHEVVKHHDPEPNSPNSVSDMGWIAPLYLTALKCRNRRIRHQAVDLLQSGRHKEGIWDSKLAFSVARQVVMIEEGDFYDHLEFDAFDKLAAPTEKELATTTLPEESRLKTVEITLPDDKTGRLWMTCRRQKQTGVVEWICKEYDLPSQQWSETHRITVSQASSDSQNENFSPVSPSLISHSFSASAWSVAYPGAGAI